MHWVVRLIGAFYLLGGLLALCAFALDWFLDRAGALVTGKALPPAQRQRAALLGVVSVLTALSGLLLALLHPLAPWLMAICVLAQLAMLLFLMRQFPPQGEDERAGRARSLRALMLFAMVAAWIVAAERHGWFGWLREPSADGVAAVGALAIIAGGLIAFLRQPTMSSHDRTTGGSPDGFVVPERLLLAPKIGDWLTGNADDPGDTFTHHRLDLSDDLTADLDIFEDFADDHLVAGDDGETRAASDDHRRYFETESARLAARIARETGRPCAWRVPWS